MASSDQRAGQTLGPWRPSLLILVGLLLVMPISNLSLAQTTTSGGLTGVVTDLSHAVVPGADVEIRDTAKGTLQLTKTDREGVYRFFFLAPGRYTLTVTHGGFREEKRAVNVLLGPPVSVNVSLEIANASTTVTVTEEAPLLQAENGDSSTTMNQQQISEVPNPGNDLTYIVQTAPGVVMNTDLQGGASFSILGMPGFSYLHTIDGMNNNDNAINLSLAGSLNLVLGQNEIQEATVVSTGYSGQFGGAAGGNVNYVTKSGSSEFHGNAQYYWNGRAFNANDWFNNMFQQPRPFAIANQWAGSFGGPIKKNKLFFFFDTEGLRLLIPQLYFVTIPSPEFEAATMANIDSRFGSTSASDAFYKKIFSLYSASPGASSAAPGGSPTDPLGCAGFSDPTTKLGIGVPCARYFFTSRGRPNQDTLASGRVDWNVSRSDRTFLRLQYDGGRSAAGSDPISSVFDADYTEPWWQAEVLETHTFGSSAASQFLLAGSYVAPIFKTKNASQALSAFPTTMNFNSGPFTNLGGADYFVALGFGRYNTQYQLSEDVVKASGNQKFGFGANFARIYWSSLPGKSNTIGQLNVPTLDAFYQGGVDPASPSVDFTSLAQSFTSQNNLPITFFNFGLYGEDEWHARPNLTLTLTLRAEHYSNPACQSRCFARLAGPFESVSHDPDQPYNQAILIHQKQAFQGIDSILWSPRFSFAWQPLSIWHNTVLRGGLGIFYDPVPGRFPASFASNPPLVNSYTIVGDNLTPQENTSLFKDAAASNAAFVDGFAAGKTLAQIQATDPSFFPPGMSVPERTTHNPQYQRWSLELQQAFGTGTSASIGYFGHHGIHGLIQNPNANAFGFGSLPSGKCTSPLVPPCAPDPRFSQVTEIDSATMSNYNGMVVSLRHRFSRWTQGLFQANYTYGHALDEVSSSGAFIFSTASLTSAQDPKNLRGSYGSADHDVRHSFNANYVWQVPLKAVLRGHGWDALVEGWQVSGTIFARSGFPYTVVDFVESSNLVRNNYFGLLYAVPAGPLGSGPSCGKGAALLLDPHPCQTPQVLVNGDGTTPNPNAHFVQSGCETGFNVGALPAASGPCDGPAVAFAQGRNHFRGPSYFNTDFTIMKKTKLPGWEKGVLGIGFQFFNLFNHPNFGFPDAGLSSPAFGQIFYLEQPPTSILGSGFGGDAAPRMIQLKAQLQF
jgi:Carboxypeptidase regulatory-like domain/TonB dependent receptor